MRRLYLQIYFAVLSFLLFFGILAVIAWLVFPVPLQLQRLLAGAGTLLGDLLPAAAQPHPEQHAALVRLSQLLPIHLSLYHADRTLLVTTGAVLPAPLPSQTASHWLHGYRGPTAALHLPDGRWVVLQWYQRHRPRGWLATLFILALAIALGAYPIVRRLTRRLERLQRRVEALGAGDLSARVEVEGHDEVAHLARSFNQAAERIAQLVKAQQHILASASHELRSPLTRIRMAVELFESRPELQQRLTRDIHELDDLIGEILLASRLHTLECHIGHEDVDLLALLAEEAVHVGAEVSGTPVSIQGDLRLLRRLVRNLLENAQRYAASSRIEATLTLASPTGVLLRISDHGPGIPEQEHERIFLPFYRLPGQHDSRGVGLGLALVRQIAQHHGGDVRCVPRPAGGTCFEVILGSCHFPTDPAASPSH